MARRIDYLDESTWFMPTYIADESKRSTLESFCRQTGQDGAPFIGPWQFADGSVSDTYIFTGVAVPCQICGQAFVGHVVVGVDVNGRICHYVGMCFDCESSLNLAMQGHGHMSNQERAERAVNWSDVPSYMKGCRFSNFKCEAVSNGTLIVNQLKGFTGASDQRRAVLMIGRTGTGKTHLAVARMYNYALENRGRSAMYTTEDWMMKEIKDSIGRKNGELEAIRRYISHPFLVIDEIGRTEATPYVMSTIQNIIQSRIEYGVKTLLCGNMDIGDVGTHIDEQNISRIKGSGNVLVVDGDDYREKNRRL